MNRKERLGLAYVRLNCWQWDDFVGEKPDGFDTMPNWVKNDNIVRTKSYYISPKMKEIENEIGSAACSRYWWKFELKKNYIKWALWYYFNKIPKNWRIAH